jgi:hypothetical protein
LGVDTEASAAGFVLANINGKRVGGVGISGDIVEATLQAVLCCLNREQLLERSSAA